MLSSDTHCTSSAWIMFRATVVLPDALPPQIPATTQCAQHKQEHLTRLRRRSPLWALDRAQLATKTEHSPIFASRLAPPPPYTHTHRGHWTRLGRQEGAPVKPKTAFVVPHLTFFRSSTCVTQASLVGTSRSASTTVQAASINLSLTFTTRPFSWMRHVCL